MINSFFNKICIKSVTFRNESNVIAFSSKISLDGLIVPVKLFNFLVEKKTCSKR